MQDYTPDEIRELDSIDSKANDRDAWLIYILLQNVDSKTSKQQAEFSSKEEFIYLRCLFNLLVTKVLL